MSKIKYSIIFLFVLIISSCGGSKNLTIRNDIKNQIKDHLRLGVEGFATGNLQTSLNYLNLALNEAKMIDNIAEQINVKVNLGSVYIALGQMNEASNYIFSAVDTIRFTGIHQYDFNVKIVLGKFYSRMSLPEQAIKSYKQALRLAKTPNQQAVAYNNLGIILRRNGDPHEALWNLNRAKVINKRKKFYDQLANNYYNIGEIYFDNKEWLNAKRNYLEALNYDKISENPLGIIDDLKRLGEIAYNRGNYSLGDHFFNRGLNVARSMKSDLKEQEIKALINQYKKQLQDTEKKDKDKTSVVVQPVEKKQPPAGTNTVNTVTPSPGKTNQ